LKNFPEITWDLSVSFLLIYGYDEMSTEPKTTRIILLF
jgi:hypothetical protein